MPARQKNCPSSECHQKNREEPPAPSWPVTCRNDSFGSPHTDSCESPADSLRQLAGHCPRPGESGVVRQNNSTCSCFRFASLPISLVRRCGSGQSSFWSGASFSALRSRRSQASRNIFRASASLQRMVASLRSVMAATSEVQNPSRSRRTRTVR